MTKSKHQNNKCSLAQSIINYAIIFYHIVITFLTNTGYYYSRGRRNMGFNGATSERERGCVCVCSGDSREQVETN